ncbi:methyltransferase domain-containing protein [Blastopirellula sp. J2-11]|uniref:class I SAM-dependent methyltransferase n=1 Tax=Blastopirellula sp. J2-11 TaxID=2943192 RepID=UPI0021C8D766|nr:methyltransferase domain-containing protein [Blastopirellula sp. J2-11]UUO08917.1 methyltransferase domain-containing protein [Blastopirellula sp. J2-11]
MKNRAILILVISIAVSIAGCSQRKETAMTEVHDDKASPQESRQEKQPMHEDHHHHHAFADPAELAKKWNDPQRDQWQHPEEIVAALALKPGATVADIGAGTGYMAAHLSNAVGKGGTVIAVDTEDAMLAYLSNRVEELRPATVIPQKASPNDPHLPNESADAILILDTWHHMGERLDYAKKIFLALKPHGRLVIVESVIDGEIGPPKEMRVPPEQVKQELEAAGFRAQVAPETMPRHYMVVADKD